MESLIKVKQFFNNMSQGDEEYKFWMLKFLSNIIHKTSAKSIFILHGQPNSGKSTLRAVIKQVYGDYAKNLPLPNKTITNSTALYYSHLVDEMVDVGFFELNSDNQFGNIDWHAIFSTTTGETVQGRKLYQRAKNITLNMDALITCQDDFDNIDLKDAMGIMSPSFKNRVYREIDILQLKNSIQQPMNYEQINELIKNNKKQFENIILAHQHINDYKDLQQIISEDKLLQKIYDLSDLSSDLSIEDTTSRFGNLSINWEEVEITI